ncbi:MAG: AAA family ATPase, partial [Spirochaetaceae bacterium]
MYERRLDLALAETESCFLWGARQTGKSTLLHQRFPEAHYYDLLKSDEYRRLLDDPSILRQEVLARRDSPHSRSLVIIDEVQKIPELLDEAHWLMENCGTRFILCGSSARKLRRGHANLLGGRAIRYELLPLTAGEIPEFDLLRALNHGLLPRIYDSPHAHRLL